MKKSNRQHLSFQVGNAIGREEFRVWAAEFDENISFTISTMHCQDKPVCKLEFRLV